MKILHFSDIHVWGPGGFEGDVNLKRLLGWLNLKMGRARRFPPTLGRSVVAAIARAEADLVIFTGDATTMSLTGEFALADTLFQPLREKWGERFLIIPGNHDRYTPRSQARRLYEQGMNGAGEALPRAVAATPDGQTAVILLDLAVPRRLTSRGRDIGPWMDASITLAREQKARFDRVVVAGHYPLAYPPGVRASWQHRLPGADRLLRGLADAGVDAYLHGHKHQRWAFCPLADAPLVCLNAGSAGMWSPAPHKRAGFLEITCGSGGPESVTAWQAADRQGQGAMVRTPLPIIGAKKQAESEDSGE